MIPSIQHLSSQYTPRIQPSHPSQSRDSSLLAINSEEATPSNNINSIKKLEKWSDNFKKSIDNLQNSRGENEITRNIKNLVKVMHQLCPKAILENKEPKQPFEFIDVIMNRVLSNAKRLNKDVNKYISRPKKPLDKEIAEIKNAILKNIMPSAQKLFSFLNNGPK